MRQGEWFFVPRPRLKVDNQHVLHNEPIRRGAGKPHMCQFLYRLNGQAVWVCDEYPDGLLESQYRELPRNEQARYRWKRMMRNARVYVKGNIRHPDHETVRLVGWHEVVMNTETRARAMRNVLIGHQYPAAGRSLRDAASRRSGKCGRPLVFQVTAAGDIDVHQGAVTAPVLG